ncbi:HAD family hydrolase [Pelosinus baikalensis]|uniref:HAD family hydrolase n=1 Tax=Pelosinus baikalensis TaxID=2892015 RepID=A0ABS8HW26_9FIRM|nr:HAD family hydrolase [Pelosinus baikalensis]MCC5466811.1 HAD family hydrolase [Pelosinus baikalensis]
MYKYLIFDIDGTIIDTEKAVIGSLQKLLKVETGIDYPADELSFVLGIPGSVALRQLNIADTDQACLKWNEYLKEFYNSIRVFPDLEEIIKYLHDLKIKTGIVTSKTKQELLDDFYPFGLHDYFDYIVCADDTTKHKPDPEPILKCLELAQASPAETIYIGDTGYDMQSAHHAGVDFALALWGTKDPNLNAKIKLSHPKELLDIVKTEIERVEGQLNDSYGQ